MSIIHNKYRNPLLNLLINCISAESAYQILSIKSECTFLLLNFLINDVIIPQLINTPLGSCCLIDFGFFSIIPPFFVFVI